MIRVLHVISGDLWAGAEVMAFNLLRELSRRPDIELHAVLMNDGKLAQSLRSEGIAVRVIDESEHGPLYTLAVLCRLCRRLRPAIVHTHRQKENVLGAVAARLSGARSLRTVHGWTEFPALGWRLDKRLFQLLDRVTGRRLQDRVVAVSAELEDKLARHFDADSITVIENGIDVAAVRQAGAAPPEIGLDPDRRPIGIVARLVPVKRHDLLLEAARILRAESPDAFAFHIVGDGPLHENLEREISRLDLTGLVHLHGFRDDVEPVIAALDALVICSDHEGLPMSALEAACLGVPLVTTPLPSIAEIIETGAAGVVCRAQTAEALAQGIRQSSRARSGWVPDATWRFSSRTMATAYATLYTTLLADGAPNRAHDTP